VRCGAPRRRAFRTRGGARLACAGALALTGCLVLAAPALGALEPVTPDDDAVVGLRPTFGWNAGSASRYEVYVELPSGPLKVADATSTTATATVPVPDDSRLRWFVRAISGSSQTDTDEADRRYIRVATSPGPPTITGAPPAITRGPQPTFTWSGTRVSSRWSILNPAGQPVQTGEVPTAGGQVVPAALPDGSYQFRVAQRNLVGVDGPPASYGFSIDTVAPGPLTLRRSTSRRDSPNTPRYAWSGLEPGAVVTWRVLRASGRVVQGPANVAAGDVTPARLASGSYVFEARQSDLAGNSGPPTTDAFVVLPRLAPGIRLPMRNVRRLSPHVGATVLGVRPTLRWRSAPKGTRTYNVQVFRVVGGSKLRKVVSAFPHRRRFVVPRKKALDRGACYVWRVWPFRGERPLKEPVGVSHFCVRPA
jgi:hypothetical protein